MDFFTLLKTILFGIIEGVTEWLPISSTGHMILADEFIHLDVTPQFKEMFLVVIQLGAILAVVMLYFKKLMPLSLKGGVHLKKDTLSLWGKVLFAVIPAAIIGLLFDDELNAVFYNYQTVAVTLILYGVLFIVLETRNRKKDFSIGDFSALSYRSAAIIGVFQILALIPGTSRSGATILGAILIGCSREIAAEFSFFLAVPVMVGASLLKILKFGLSFTQSELIILLCGMVSAFLVSILAIKFLIGYLKKNDFKAFGYYRIILGLLVILVFAFLK